MPTLDLRYGLQRSNVATNVAVRDEFLTLIQSFSIDDCPDDFLLIHVMLVVPLRRCWA